MEFKKFIVTETTSYLIEGADEEDARDFFLEALSDDVKHQYFYAKGPGGLEAVELVEKA
jgi:hypothetical protein